MNRSIDEQLFIKLHQMPHFLRGKMEDGRGPEGHGEHDEHGGREGHGPMRHGPMGRGGFGRPMGHGPREHGPEYGHGPEERRGPGHGPEGERRGPKPLSRERVLSVLLQHDGGVRQKVLAEELRVNPSSISEFVDILEGGGYLSREVDPADKRATLISLTEKGRARACELEDEKQERFSRLFSGLSEEEKHELLRLLEKLTEA
ncbi:MAG: MarR family transcriptional regulator [Mogibacterium sp.]|nr:MarR family transcriptional regulator [Mogibacterium sp.]